MKQTGKCAVCKHTLKLHGDQLGVCARKGCNCLGYTASAKPGTLLHTFQKELRKDTAYYPEEPKVGFTAKPFVNPAYGALQDAAQAVDQGDYQAALRYIAEAIVAIQERV